MTLVGIILVSSIISLLLLYVRSLYRKNAQPNLMCKDLRVKRVLLRKIVSFNKGVPCTFWAQNRYLQTCIRTIIDILQINQVETQREFLELNDGGIVSFDSSKEQRTRKNSSDNKPVLVIIPSTLNANTESYSQLFRSAIKHGFLPVVFNRRGYNRNPLVDSKFSLHIDITDFEQVFKYINTKYPFNDVLVISFSIESTSLINYLNKKERDSNIYAAVCISSTFGVENSSKDHSLRKNMYNVFIERLYSIFSQHSLLRELFTSQEIFRYKENAKIKDRKRISFQQFDQNVFSVKNIRIPVLFISSLDDPTIHSGFIPDNLTTDNEHCILVTTDKGGHCGFYKDAIPVSWSEELSLEFFGYTLNNKRLFYRPTTGILRSRSLTCA